MKIKVDIARFHPAPLSIPGSRHRLMLPMDFFTRHADALNYLR
jgi:hypothetical protein